METLTRKQWALLIPLTLAWGLNWPVMKLGIVDFPPITFRTLSLWLGLPVLGLALVAMKVPFRVPRRHWPELLWLGATNMFVWHACMIVALKQLSSGRAAILGYTMPIFSAVVGALFFATALSRRGWLGVSAAALGVVLLLWHEFTGLAGRPSGVALALFAAMVWAFGTQLLRRTRIDVPTLTISFWMTVLSAVAMALLALLFERPQWKAPGGATWFAIRHRVHPYVAAALVFGSFIVVSPNFFLQYGMWLLIPLIAMGYLRLALALSVYWILPILLIFKGQLGLGQAKAPTALYAAMGDVLLAILAAVVVWLFMKPRPAVASSGT